jgi:hypothetical protein
VLTIHAPQDAALTLAEQHRRDTETARVREGLFVASHRLRQYSNSRHNIARILRAGDASESKVRSALDRVAPIAATDGLFDHACVYGREHEPVALVGSHYPGNLRAEDWELLADLRALGLSVLVDSESFYGSGTWRVIVASPGFFFTTHHGEDTSPF